MSELKKTTDYPDQESGKKKRYLITYQKGIISTSAIARIHNIPEVDLKEGVSFLSTTTEFTDDHKLHFYNLGVSSIALTPKEVTVLSKNKLEIFSIEEETEVHILGFPSEEDSNLCNEQGVNLWNIEYVKAPEAWKKGATGDGVNLAILDTGIANHPDLVIVGGVSFIPESNSYNDDNGHGTHCAGIAAGVGHKKVYGVARDCNLYAVKVLNNEGKTTATSVFAGLDWCTTNNIHVANLSLGYSGTPPSIAYARAIKNCQDSGVTVVCASGNDYLDLFYYVLPPANSFFKGELNASPIAVGSIAENYVIAKTSSRGIGYEDWNPVTVVAPGVNICSTYLNNSYAPLSGTSMACPHVAGLAALILQKYPKITPLEVKQKIIAGATALGHSPYPNEAYGYGLINCQQSTL